jgi:hypothetical protein
VDFQGPGARFQRGDPFLDLQLAHLSMSLLTGGRQGSIVLTIGQQGLVG